MDIDEQLRAEVEAESAIRDILLKLEETTGKRVDGVRVDTGNFVGCLDEIFGNYIFDSQIIPG